MAELSLRNVRKSFSGTEVIHDVNLDDGHDDDVDELDN